MGGRFLCGVAGAISHISIREVIRFFVCESELLHIIKYLLGISKKFYLFEFQMCYS